MITYLINNTHLVAANLSYVSTVWFLFILIFDKSKYVPAILFSAWLGYSILIGFHLYDPLSYIEVIQILILIDGATAMAITMFLNKDKKAKYQAAILAFAVSCHTMILYSIKLESVGFFYTYYDELIITVAIAQMAVSYDGFIRATINSHRKLEGVLLWNSFRAVCYFKNLFNHKKRAVKA